MGHCPFVTCVTSLVEVGRISNKYHSTLHGWQYCPCCGCCNINRSTIRPVPNNRGPKGTKEDRGYQFGYWCLCASTKEQGFEWCLSYRATFQWFEIHPCEGAIVSTRGMNSIQSRLFLGEYIESATLSKPFNNPGHHLYQNPQACDMLSLRYQSRNEPQGADLPLRPDSVATRTIHIHQVRIWLSRCLSPVRTPWTLVQVDAMFVVALLSASCPFESGQHKVAGDSSSKSAAKYLA